MLNRTSALLRARRKKIPRDKEQKKVETELSGVENRMDAGTTLITKTDLNGRITYANDRFAHISESTVHDLLGKPHSLIRHPAMPRSAFYDLWQTIQAGNPWRGIVVNRAISGNHYWVDANVAPRRENGEVVGYISVRRKPDEETRQKAERLYAAILSGKEELPPSNRHRLSISGRLFLFAAAVALFCPLTVGIARFHFLTGLICSIFCGVVAILTALHLKRIIVEPILHTAKLGNRMATGDLTVQLEHDRNDEIGEIQKAMLNLMINTAGIIGQIGEASERLEANSAETRKSAANLKEGSGHISMDAVEIASGAEEMNRSLQFLASSVEELSISMHEVASQASGANTLVKDSRSEIDRATEAVTSLSASAKHAGEVVDTIQSIAAQTNLLALNATIEAAAAGEAGKGFAVVAGEVKALSQQAGKAAETVRDRMKEIQKKVQETLSIVTEVRKGSLSLQEISTGIAGAAEEQSVTVKEVAKSISEAATASSDVARRISSISQTTQSGLKDAMSLEEAATSTDEAAKVLRQTVASFRV